MDPGTAMLISSGLGMAGSIGGGVLAGSGNKESKMQKTQRHLVDKLLASLSGQGPYSDLFNYDESAFQKSFVEPAKSMFQNQIAPQIQQQYIASGQQRGTGLDDTLTRAGVDMDQLLNQYMMHYQEAAKQRGVGALGSILGVQGAPPQQSFGQNLGQATAGYFASPAFGETIKGLSKTDVQQKSNIFNQPTQPTRKGYLPDWGLGDPRWSN